MDPVTLGMAKVDASRRVRRAASAPAAFGGGIVAANRSAGPIGAINNSTDSCRVARKMVNGGSAIRLVYTNIAKLGTGEDPNYSGLHVKAAIEYPLGSVVPASFGGKPCVTIAPGGSAVSDPIAVNVPVGGTFYERASVSPPLPPVVAATGSSTGGALAAATYYYTVTSVTDAGESNASTEVSAVVTGSTSKVTLTVGDRHMAGVNVLGYNVYRSTSAGTEVYLATFTGRRFVDDGSVVAISTTLTVTASGVRQITVGSTVGMAVGDTITVNATPHVIALVSSSVLVNTVAAVTATSGVTVALGSTSPSSTRNVPVNSIVYPSQDANEGYRGGYDLAHNANSVTYSGSDGRGTYIAAAVLAQPAANAATIKPAIALIGDSIMNGTGWVKTIGPYRGFGAYALNELFPYVNVSCAGESAYQFADTTKSNTRVAYIQHCDYSVCEYGTNDLGRTESQIKAALVTIAQRAIIAGVKGHYQTTLIPRSASTDGHQTVASQTISTGADTMRQTINAWLRAPASAGSGNSFRYDVGSTFTTYVGIFDTAALVEYNADGSLIAIAADGTISNGVGGRWKAYGTTQYATKVGTTTGTTTTLTDSGATWTVNAWQGYMAAITTGGTTVYTQVISNTATVLTLNDTITAPTGSTTYFIYKGPTVDGIHPTDFIHKEMAAAINTGLFV